MAIFFPPEAPIKFFRYADRSTKAAVYELTRVHFRDDGHFQFWDPLQTTNRVLVLDETFTILGELTGTEINMTTIGSVNVTTFHIAWQDYFSEGDKGYLAVLDANNNYYFHNFLPNGSFTSGDNWTLEADITITGGNLVFNAAGAVTRTATYGLPLKNPAEYTVEIDYQHNAGTTTFKFYNGSGVEINENITSGEPSGTLSATFTTDDDEISLEFSCTAAAGVTISEVRISMSAADTVPDWISAPFCIQDLETKALIHGTSASNVFNQYFTGLSDSFTYIPRLRVNSEMRDIAPEQEIESIEGTDGNFLNHYVKNKNVKEFRIDWLPAYLIGFLSTVFFYDWSAIDNEGFRLNDTVDIQSDENDPNIAGVICQLVDTDRGLSFKRVINDPTTAEVNVTTGAYVNQLTGQQYTQQQGSEAYYPQS